MSTASDAPTGIYTAGSSEVSDITPTEASDEKAVEAVEGQLVAVVNSVIWPKKQFIVLEGELDGDGKLAKKTLKALHMNREDWSKIKSKVREKLRDKRNNTQNLVRRALNSKFVVLVTLLHCGCS
jgi:hypothetical protein